MKVVYLLIAVAALSSCVAKPWMVGSVNDHYDAPELEDSHLLYTETTVVQEETTINPVNKTGIYPSK